MYELHNQYIFYNITIHEPDYMFSMSDKYIITQCKYTEALVQVCCRDHGA